MQDIIETDHKSYLRDLNSKALLCNDRAALEKYRLEKNKKMKQISEINTLKNEVGSLKDEIQEIKKLLIEYLSKEK